MQYSGAYSSVGVDNSLQLEQFRKNFRVEVIRLNKEDMEFDMIGVDPSLANAFRRILIAEVRLFMLFSVCLMKGSFAMLVTFFRSIIHLVHCIS